MGQLTTHRSRINGSGMQLAWWIRAGKALFLNGTGLGAELFELRGTAGCGSISAILFEVAGQSVSGGTDMPTMLSVKGNR